MDTSSILDSFNLIGDKISELTAWIIIQLSNLGASTTDSTAKVINLLLFSILIYGVVKFISFARKPIKYIIIILLVFVLVSTLISFIN
jgi:hypothetical protein